MRCGKELRVARALANNRRNPHECAVAKILSAMYTRGQYRRNPHECAVAKKNARLASANFEVATRTNALWQRPPLWFLRVLNLVATRTNALWQRWVAIQIFSVVTSQPARMRCGKVMRLAKRLQPTGRNPRECAVAKSRHCCARTENSENMNYVLLF